MPINFHKIQSRRSKKHKLCFNCLKSERNSFKCTIRACLKCNHEHNTLLNINKYKRNNKIKGEKITQACLSKKGEQLKQVLKVPKMK